MSSSFTFKCTVDIALASDGHCESETPCRVCKFTAFMQMGID